MDCTGWKEFKLCSRVKQAKSYDRPFRKCRKQWTDWMCPVFLKRTHVMIGDIMLRSISRKPQTICVYLQVSHWSTNTVVAAPCSSSIRVRSLQHPLGLGPCSSCSLPAQSRRPDLLRTARVEPSGRKLTPLPVQHHPLWVVFTHPRCPRELVRNAVAEYDWYHYLCVWL